MTATLTISREMPIDPYKVVAARTAIGLTQRQLAAKMGVHQQAIARIESGERLNPQLSTADSLARALGVTIDSLLGGKSAKSRRGGKR